MGSGLDSSINKINTMAIQDKDGGVHYCPLPTKVDWCSGDSCSKGELNNTHHAGPCYAVWGKTESCSRLVGSSVGQEGGAIVMPVPPAKVAAAEARAAGGFDDAYWPNSMVVDPVCCLPAIKVPARYNVVDGKLTVISQASQTDYWTRANEIGLINETAADSVSLAAANSTGSNSCNRLGQVMNQDYWRFWALGPPGSGQFFKEETNYLRCNKDQGNGCHLV